MAAIGYKEAKNRANLIASILRDTSILLGDKKTEQIALENGGIVVPGLGLVKEADMLYSVSEGVEKGIFRITIVGGYGSGRNTFLNAILESVILGQGDLTTNNITEILYGNDDGVLVFLSDMAEPIHYSWERYKSEFQLTCHDLNNGGYLDRFKDIDHTQIKRVSPFLANGTILIDIPTLWNVTSRTKVETRFLKQSQAIIILLNAFRLIHSDEKKYIEQVLLHSYCVNVFFIVNNVNELDQSEADEVKEYVKEYLEHHFLTKDGKFDEINYNRRVFFISARQALHARLATSVCTTDLERSGVPAFERELEMFLTDNKRIEMVFNPITKTLCECIDRARFKIALKKVSLGNDHNLDMIDDILIRLRKAANDISIENEDFKNRWDIIMSANTMDISGYSSAKTAIDMVTSVLDDIATLIGEKQNYEITLNNGGQIVPGLGLIKSANTIKKLIDDNQQGAFKVIVVGEFKNGKSTFLNAILGNKTLIAKSTPATAIVTQLIYGTNKDVGVYESNKKDPISYSWDEYKLKFQLDKNDQHIINGGGKLDRFSNIEYAQIERTHPFLANSVMLIDSPGLGEAVSRTKLSTRHLGRSQAAIFLLNARQILRDDERKFIENVFGNGRLNHVFFVINMIDLVEPDEVEDLKDYVKEGLRNHFLNEEGTFDEDFYNRRVFFVSAKQALDARISNPVNNAMLDASGIPAFEKELEKFLSSDDKLKAIFQSACENVIIPVVSKARRNIAIKKKATDQKLEDLEIRRALTQARLNKLTKKRDQINYTCKVFGDMIGQKLYSSLEGYTKDMLEPDNWEKESSKLISLEEINSWLVIKAVADDTAKQEIRNIISPKIRIYLDKKFDDWSHLAPDMVKEDINAFRHNISEELADFEMELSQIETYFSQGREMDYQEKINERDRIDKTIEEILGVLKQSSQTQRISGDEDVLKDLMMKIATDILIFIIANIIFAPLSVFVLLIQNIFSISREGSSYRNRIRKIIGEGLRKDLPQILAENRDNIYRKFQESFQSSIEGIIEVLQEKIDQENEEEERIIADKKNKGFSVELEKNRLELIDNKLIELFNIISMAAYGKILPPEELDQIGKARSMQ